MHFPVPKCSPRGKKTPEKPYARHPASPFRQRSRSMPRSNILGVQPSTPPSTFLPIDPDNLTTAVTKVVKSMFPAMSDVAASPGTSQASAIEDQEMTDASTARPHQKEGTYTREKEVHSVGDLNRHTDKSPRLMEKLANTDPLINDFLQSRDIDPDRLSETSSLNNSQANLVDSIPGEFSTPRAAKTMKRKHIEKFPLPPAWTQNRFAALASQATGEEVSSSNTPPSRPEEKCPPVVLHETAKWNHVSAQLKAAKINYTKARATSSGVNIFLGSVTDFRKTISLLDGLHVQYHFYKLRSEKPLKIVIRGLPSSIGLPEIEEDLRSKGYDELKVSRLSDRDGKPYPLVLVEISRKYKNLFHETTVCDLVVSMESMYRRASTGQCHRCQRFGHAQSGCRADYRCLKCAEGHSTHLCPKQKSLPAKCANCRGEHPANYRGCPESPRNKLQEVRQPQNRPARSQVLPPQMVWRQKLAASAPQKPSHPDQASFPPLPRRGEAPPAASDNPLPQRNSKKEEVARQIGSIILQFSAMNPSPGQLSELIQTVTTLARLID